MRRKLYEGKGRNECFSQSSKKARLAGSREVALLKQRNIGASGAPLLRAPVARILLTSRLSSISLACSNSNDRATRISWGGGRDESNVLLVSRKDRRLV